MDTATISCPNCQLQVLPAFYFCPNCGKQLRPKPIVVSVGRQLGVYFLSFFFPPMGLSYAMRYLKQPNQKTKIVGGVALFIIISSIILSIYSYIIFIQQLYSLYPQIVSQQQLGL